MNEFDVMDDKFRPTEEEQEYLDRYFPKGDKRRGEALVLYAYMKSKQIKLIKQLEESSERRKKRDENYNQPKRKI